MTLREIKFTEVILKCQYAKVRIDKFNCSYTR